MQVNRESINVFDDYILVPQDEKKGFSISSCEEHIETIVCEVAKKEIIDCEEKVLNFPKKSIDSESVKDITTEVNTLRRRHIPDLHVLNQNIQKQNAQLAIENQYVKHKNKKLNKELIIKDNKIEKLENEKIIINKENLSLCNRVRVLTTETQILKTQISQKNQELDNVLEMNNIDSQIIEEKSQFNIEAQQRITEAANNLLREVSQETSIVVSERQALETKCQSLSRTNKILIVVTTSLAVIGVVVIGIGIAVLAGGML